jgi:hypothetical protein
MTRHVSILGHRLARPPYLVLCAAALLNYFAVLSAPAMGQVAQSVDIATDTDAQPAPANTARVAPAVTAKVDVTTYHYDNRRNGWNNAETVLTPSNLGSQFNLLHSVSLDEQVDAQPLVLTGQTITGQGTHDVVYVATENNTIYAIDSSSGAVLLTQNFGSPVPIQILPGQCNNNSAVVGINSTPVIDPATRDIYVITYTLESGVPFFRLHVLDPSTLKDLVAPPIISASQKLSDGSTYNFNATYTRQRPALLEVNGYIYAGFGSFCDFDSNVSRGWILGWKANSLTPIAHLTNTLAASRNNWFLTAVWMSGYGLAAEGYDNLFFATGNSDPSGTSYNTALNLSESAVKISLNLSTVKDYFTPSNAAVLESQDGDFGSGGVMALPMQPGRIPSLVVAGGKDGRMFLMNRTFMGGYSTTQNRVLGTFSIGGCWCGPSYFVGADGVGRVVSSGGNQIKVWRIQTSPSTTLVSEVASAQLPAGVQDLGSFTTISSNGTQLHSAVIWTVRRPTNNTTKDVTLYAFDPSTGTTLTSRSAGAWPNLGNNANIVPVVANGEVFVASYKQLAIFGLGAPAARIAFPNVITVPAPNHRVSGQIVGIDSNRGLFTILTRSGKRQLVLATGAIQSHTAVPLVIGQNVEVQGSFDSAGVLQSTVIAHAKQPAAWSPDQ